MAELKLRYNPDTEEVELVVDNEVALSSGKEVFESWVDAHNEAHPDKFVEPEPTEEEKLRQQVADLEQQLAVANAANEPEPEPEHEAPVEPEVDTEEQS